jgi:hypothetical protein
MEERSRARAIFHFGCGALAAVSAEWILSAFPHHQRVIAELAYGTSAVEGEQMYSGKPRVHLSLLINDQWVLPFLDQEGSTVRVPAFA